MIKSIFKTVLKPVWQPFRNRIELLISNQLTSILHEASVRNQKIIDFENTNEAHAHQMHDQLTLLRRELSEQHQKITALQHVKDIHIHQINTLNIEINAVRHMTYAPNPALQQSSSDAPFMQYSNCQASDFFHPRYIQLCKLIDQRPRLHRKQWEFIYVLHKLLETGVLTAGARGLVFGVGREPLPAVFAAMGIDITATDAPLDLTATADWVGSDQHSSAVEGLMYPAIVPDDKLRKHVTYDFCDMNAIDSKFNGYDFNWSSCCFEHLGSIEAGLRFVVNAVENTLKVGGVAVHTTEYNVVSDTDTVETGGTVIFRHRDIIELVQRLRERGHEVEVFNIGPAAHALDFHVDAPPYSGDVHLKLQLASYVTTSVGLVVRRGR
jgi:hypothetical protein